MNGKWMLLAGIAGVAPAMLFPWNTDVDPDIAPVVSPSSERFAQHAGSAEDGVVKDRIRERLHGLDRLCTAAELEFKATGTVSRVVEALEQFRAQGLPGLAKLELALAGIGRAQLEAVYAEFWKRAFPADEANVDAYRLLFRAWGRLDGAGALERVMRDLPENRVRLEGGREAMESWASLDPAATARKVASLPEAYGKDYLIYALPHAYVATDPVAAAEWANGLPPTYRSNALLHAMIAWLDREPLGARGYATRLASQPDAVNNDNGVVFSRVAGHLARENIERAVEWTGQLPENSKAKECALVGVIDWWAVADRGQAAEWLRTLAPSPTVDPAIDRFARDLVRFDPVAAADWGKSISRDGPRAVCVNAVLAAWAELDSNAPVKWARANGYGDLPALRQELSSQ